MRDIAKHRSRVIQILALIESRIDYDKIMLASGGLTPIAISEALEGRTSHGVPGQIDYAD
jgi:hypothetical protein